MWLWERYERDYLVEQDEARPVSGEGKKTGSCLLPPRFGRFLVSRSVAGFVGRSPATHPD